jgi:hypothetical protein
MNHGKDAVEKERTNGRENGVLPQGNKEHKFPKIVPGIWNQRPDRLQMAGTIFRARQPRDDGRIPTSARSPREPG